MALLSEECRERMYKRPPRHKFREGYVIHQLNREIEWQDCKDNGYMLTNDVLGHGEFSRVEKAEVLPWKLNCSKTLQDFFQGAEVSKVAIKIINKLKTPKSYLEKFIPREVESIRKLPRYEFICSYLECFWTIDRVYIVTEYVEGRTLSDYIEQTIPRGQLLPDIDDLFVRTLFREICLAVWTCHLNGVIHRDLKAENIIVTPNGDIKLIDFGFSFCSCNKTRDILYTVCGSRAYAAPEVIMGHPYNGPLADIWSLGIILFTITHGVVPFQCKNVHFIEDMKSQRIAPGHDVSYGCIQLIRQILQFNPSKRPSIRTILLNSWMVSGYTPQIKDIRVRKKTYQSSSKTNLTESQQRFFKLRGRGKFFELYVKRPHMGLGGSKVPQAIGTIEYGLKEAIKRSSLTMFRAKSIQERETNERIVLPGVRTQKERMATVPKTLYLHHPREIRRRRIPEKISPKVKHQNDLSTMTTISEKYHYAKRPRFPQYLDEFASTFTLLEYRNLSPKNYQRTPYATDAARARSSKRPSSKSPSPCLNGVPETKIERPRIRTLSNAKAVNEPRMSETKEEYVRQFVVEIVARAVNMMTGSATDADVSQDENRSVNETSATSHIQEPVKDPSIPDDDLASKSLKWDTDREVIVIPSAGAVIMPPTDDGKESMDSLREGGDSEDPEAFNTQDLNIVSTLGDLEPGEPETGETSQQHITTNVVDDTERPKTESDQDEAEQKPSVSDKLIANNERGHSELSKSHENGSQAAQSGESWVTGITNPDDNLSVFSSGTVQSSVFLQADGVQAQLSGASYGQDTLAVKPNK